MITAYAIDLYLNRVLINTVLFGAFSSVGRATDF
jgi:hypothetical protein